MGAGDCVRWFLIPDDVEIKSKLNKYGERIAEGSRSRWWTNLDHNKRHEKLELFKTYNFDDYPKYDHYNAIEVSKMIDIPKDYDGVMGVPITFLDKYNPEQFEIIGQLNVGCYMDETGWQGSKGINMLSINGKTVHKRLLIKRK